MTSYRPPGFAAKAADGHRLIVDDVDGLLELAADHAGRSLERLDRRRLEEGLSMTGAPPREIERAVQVFVGRARQRRLARVRTAARRLRRTGVLVVVAVLAVLYAVRLERNLARRHDRLVAASREVEAAATRERLASRGLADLHLADPAFASREEARRRAETELASARRGYDALASEYLAAVRGFPTAPFARLVGLPTRVPRSFEPDGPGRRAPR